MLNSDDVDVDLFYDSVDCFRSCDSVSSEEEEEVSCSGRVEIDYSIWVDQPGSVVERRKRFLQAMGFVKFVDYSHKIDKIVPSSLSLNQLELERLMSSGDAVTSCSGTSSGAEEEEEAACSGRELDSENTSSEKTVSYYSEATSGIWSHDHQFMSREVASNRKKSDGQKKSKSWWKRLVSKKNGAMCKCDVSIKNCQTPNENKMTVRHRKKKCKEFTAVYIGQEIQAHKGFIFTMKFSPDGQYLASGGEDGVVRVWRVTTAPASPRNFTADGNSILVRKANGGKIILQTSRSNDASVIIPHKVFKIEETPLHEFHGHTNDVLDLCWSKSNCLLSSSKDKTVRMWQVGSKECLRVFQHNNYVTCIQFNPVDDGYFISGSIDGKVRIWGVSESRVVDWADMRDIITAICYQPDGQGFIVGSITGNCRFYEASGNNLQMDAQISVQGRKKSSSKRVTGFQFSPEDSRKVMITSADSKVRIFDGVDVIQKYRGRRKSGSQMSASFTSNGTHIISLGEDSRVYVWNYDDLCAVPSKQAKTVRTCEHFFLEGASVAIPWLGMEQGQIDSSLQSSSRALENVEAASLLRDSPRFSLGGWFSMDGRLRGSTTWPEEKLPLWAVPDEDEDHDHQHPQYPDHQQQEYRHQDGPAHQEYLHHSDHTALSATWGLVIVTGSCDGKIRTFHNYGLPVRI